jgi:hypothetical protein
MLFIALLFAGFAFVSDARRGALTALAILLSSATVAAYGLLTFRPGLLLVLFYGLPCSIAGYRGAKAMLRDDLPMWTERS